MNIPEKQADNSAEGMVVIVSGTNDQGKDLWALIRMSMLSFAHVSEAAETGKDINFNKLGEILDTGWGDLPAEDDLQSIYKKYGEIEKLSLKTEDTNNKNS